MPVPASSSSSKSNSVMELSIEETITEDTDDFLLAYQQLSEKPPSTVRFFDHGDCYTLYEADAIRAVEDSMLSSSNDLRKLQNFGNSLTIEYINLTKSEFEVHVRQLLLFKQLKVEVWANRGKNDWFVQYKGSPGNLCQFDDIVYGTADINVNNGVVGIRIGMTGIIQMVGVGFVSLSETIIHLTEFADNDVLSNLESVLVQLSPKEAIVSICDSEDEEYIDLTQLYRILEKLEILVTEEKCAALDTANIIQDLRRIFRVKTKQLQNLSAIPELQNTLAVLAIGAVIKYLELMPNDAFAGQFTLTPFDIGLCVKMDSAACEALHLTEGKNLTSLTSVIDHCRTAQGHRLLAQYLRQPLTSKVALEERLDLVELFVSDLALRQELHEEYLPQIPDCQLLARKFQKKKATLQDCYKTYKCLKKLSGLIKLLENHKSEKSDVFRTNFIDPLQSYAPDFDKFKEMIQSTLDLAGAEQGEFLVRSDFTESLQELRTEMDAIKEEMERKARRSQNKTTTDALTRLNDLYRVKVRDYEEAQKEFVEEFLSIACDYYTNLEQLGSILAKLDVLVSLAVAACNSSYPFVRPIIHPRGTGILKFSQLRHPCIEAQSGVSFVPNDVAFCKNETLFYIVTGPKMSGKSTFLRSVGIATLLAHIGSFVPAEEAEVSIVDLILARVDAEDSFINGVSTFMTGMMGTSNILRSATMDSLVLIDDLGRGIPTYDGFGLCWSISNHLAKKVKCFTILATDMHEIRTLEQDVESVRNVHMTASPNQDALAMLYKLELGPFGLAPTEEEVQLREQLLLNFKLGRSKYFPSIIFSSLLRHASQVLTEGYVDTYGIILNQFLHSFCILIKDFDEIEFNGLQDTLLQFLIYDWPNKCCVVILEFVSRLYGFICSIAPDEVVEEYLSVFSKECMPPQIKFFVYPAILRRTKLNLTRPSVQGYLISRLIRKSPAIDESESSYEPLPENDCKIVRVFWTRLRLRWKTTFDKTLVPICVNMVNILPRLDDTTIDTVVSAVHEHFLEDPVTPDLILATSVIIGGLKWCDWKSSPNPTWDKICDICIKLLRSSSTSQAIPITVKQFATRTVCNFLDYAQVESPDMTANLSTLIKREFAAEPPAVSRSGQIARQNGTSTPDIGKCLNVMEKIVGKIGAQESTRHFTEEEETRIRLIINQLKNLICKD